MKTISVDFDGVIHSYTSPWTTADEVRDPPVPGAMEWLVQASQRFIVCISSARSSQPGGIEAMKTWLAHHELPPSVLEKIQFPTEKPKAVLYIDDRAFRFEGDFPTMAEIDEFRPWNRRA